MMDLHLFLGRSLSFVTAQSNDDDDGLIGALPQHLLDEEDDIYKVREEEDICKVTRWREEDICKVEGGGY